MLDREPQRYEMDPTDPPRVTPPRQDKPLRLCAVGFAGCSVRATTTARIPFGTSGVVRKVPACHRCAQAETERTGDR